MKIKWIAGFAAGLAIVGSAWNNPGYADYNEGCNGCINDEIDPGWSWDHAGGGMNEGWHRKSGAGLKGVNIRTRHTAHAFRAFPS